MKLIILAFAAIAMAVAAANSIPFTDCSGGSSKAVISSLTATPFPPVKGKAITISAAGKLSEQVTAATYTIIVKYAGIQLLKKTGDLCTLSPDFKCPHAAGPLSVSDSLTIPSVAPSGAYELTISAVDQNKADLLCVDVKLSIGEDEALPVINPIRIIDSDERVGKAPIPHGSYCGGISGIVELKISVVNTTNANVTGTIFGTTHSCPYEAVTYDSSTHVVSLPTVTKKGDCVGSLLSSEGIDPATMKITYDPSTNSLDVNTQIASITLNACK